GSLRLGAEAVDEAGSADRDREMPERSVEEDDARLPADRVRALDGSRPCVDHEQDLSVAGAEETSGLRIEIESMRARGRHGKRVDEPGWIGTVDHDDLRRIHDVHVESPPCRVENG